MTRWTDRHGHTVEPTPTGLHVRNRYGHDVTSNRLGVPRPHTLAGLAALGVDLDSLIAL